MEQPGFGRSDNFSYSAFISYEIDSGADLAVRVYEYLQYRKLPESFRNLPHTENEIGGIYLNIRRKKNTDWPTAIKEALCQSKYLIIICGKSKKELGVQSDTDDYHYLNAAVKLFLGFNPDLHSSDDVLLTDAQVDEVLHNEEKLFKLKNLIIPFVIDDDLPENHTWKRRIPQNLQRFLGIIDVNRTKYIRPDCLPAVAAFHMFGLKDDKSTFEDLYYSDFLDYPLSHYDYAASVVCYHHDRASKKNARKIYRYLRGFKVPLWYRKKETYDEKEIEKVCLRLPKQPGDGTFKYLVVIPSKNRCEEERQLNAAIKSFLGYRIDDKPGSELINDSECKDILRDPIKRTLLNEYMFCYDGGWSLKNTTLPHNLRVLKPHVKIVSEKSAISAAITRFSLKKLSRYEDVKYVISIIIIFLSIILIYHKSIEYYIYNTPQYYYFKYYDYLNLSLSGVVDEDEINSYSQLYKLTRLKGRTEKIERISADGYHVGGDRPWDGLYPFYATYFFVGNVTFPGKIYFNFTSDRMTDVWDLSNYDKIKFSRLGGHLYRGEAISIEEFVYFIQEGGLIRHNPYKSEDYSCISYCDVEYDENKIEKMYFKNAYHFPVTNSDGASGFAFEYTTGGRDGDDSLLSGIYLIDVHGNRIANASGVSGVKLDYVERDVDIRKITCVGLDNEACCAKSGVSSMVLTWKNGNVNTIRFIDNNDKNVCSLDGVHMYELKYNNRGYLMECCFYDDQLKRCTHVSKKYSRLVYKRNSMQYPTEEAFYDENNHLTERFEGYARMERKFNSNNQLVEVLFYNKDNKLTKNSANYARARYEYGEDGQQKLRAYYDENNKPVCLPGSNVHKIVVESELLEDGGKKERRLSYGIDEQPLHASLGEACHEYIYDKNKRLTGERCYNHTGEPWYADGLYSEVKNEYDHGGGWIQRFYADSVQVCTQHGYYATRVVPVKDGFLWESYLDTDNKACAHSDGYYYRKYSKDARESLEFYYDEQEKPCVSTSLGVYGKSQRFDEHGRLVEECLLDEHGQLTMSHANCSIIKIEYTENVCVMTVYDDNGQAAVHVKGWHEQREYFDEKGYLLEVKFFGKGGVPCLSEWGYHSCKYSYDENGNEIEILYFDTKDNRLEL